VNFSNTIFSFGSKVWRTVILLLLPTSWGPPFSRTVVFPCSNSSPQREEAETGKTSRTRRGKVLGWVGTQRNLPLPTSRVIFVSLKIFSLLDLLSFKRTPSSGESAFEFNGPSGTFAIFPIQPTQEDQGVGALRSGSRASGTFEVP